jgi:hypothetical protein
VNIQTESGAAAAPLFLGERSVLSALAAFGGTFFAVFVMFGAAFAAIVLAVTHDGVIAQFAGAFRAVAGTVVHESDSMVMVVRVRRMRTVIPV